MQRYSQQFRNMILHKMIGPQKRKAADLAAEYGVSLATINGWKAKLNHGTLLVMDNETNSTERSPTEKLMLLLEAYRIPQDELGEWLRRNGLHSQHLELWEQELKTLLTTTSNVQGKDLKLAHKRLKEQEKELAKKDKALAELTTIIALQKKTALLFEEREDD